jgi:hypothetical protein
MENVCLVIFFSAKKSVDLPWGVVCSMDDLELETSWSLHPLMLGKKNMM